MVIRDSQGQAVASLSEQIHLPFSTDMVEALTTARAVSFALEIGCSPFILKGDSELVIKTLCSEERSLSLYGHGHTMWMEDVSPHLYYVLEANIG